MLQNNRGVAVLNAQLSGVNTLSCELPLQSVIDTNTHSSTHLQLLQAPAGVLLWRVNLLVLLRFYK